MPDSQKEGPIFADDFQRSVIAALERVGAQKPCPRCGNESFALLDGFVNPIVQDNLSAIAFQE
ncbi:MAG: hypothetical protein DME00_32625 [Candidatus Rokuibacteriota bacterium]|nr:MAG: hypothetical protein DME00_32625 [Candidatus Rokubacteria bacterium]PYO04724.1 MAG: hypothetical protein DMD75_30450 [Candidatus Rokubacteria bacterium]